MPERRLSKLVEKVLRNPKDVDFDDLHRLLIGFGFECRQPGSGSSHYIFRKPGQKPITVPKNKPVKKVYVTNVIRLLNLEEWHEENR